MSPKEAVILGYGFTGQSIDRILSNSGYRTVGVRRNWDGKTDQAEHYEPLEANITDRTSLGNLPEDPDVVVNCVSSGSRGDVSRYRKVYHEGSRNLLDWARSNRPGHVVWTGSTSVYGQQKGAWVRETDELNPESEAAEVLVETEELYRTAQSDDSFDVTILRLSGIYGKGRARSLDQFLDQDSLTLSKANKILNMIHRDDVARTIAKIVEENAGGETFNVTDDEPVTRRRFYFWLSQRLDHPIPQIEGGGTEHPRGNKRVSNDKLHEHLELSLKYPTYREGYGHILQDRGLVD